MHVDVWSPQRSMPCFLQPHRAGERWLRRGRGASTGTSKPSAVQMNVSHKGWSQASLAAVVLEVRFWPGGSLRRLGFLGLRTGHDVLIDHEQP